MSETQHTPGSNQFIGPPEPTRIQRFQDWVRDLGLGATEAIGNVADFGVAVTETINEGIESVAKPVDELGKAVSGLASTVASVPGAHKSGRLMSGAAAVSAAGASLQGGAQSAQVMGDLSVETAHGVRQALSNRLEPDKGTERIRSHRRRRKSKKRREAERRRKAALEAQKKAAAKGGKGNTKAGVRRNVRGRNFRRGQSTSKR